MSASRFDLIVAAETDRPVARLTLYDEAGAELAQHEADFASIRAGLRDGLFDLREHVQRYAEALEQVRAVADVGQCIAEQVLGDAIMAALWRPEHQRTLRIQLPGATDAGSPLAAALARVPWEIARPAADQATLAERNLLVRVVHDMSQPASQPLQLDADEPLRLLFVFAEARGSRPLAVRAERLALLQLLQREVYPQRRVEAHVLCHGVTRDHLREQIREHGGYHLLHWSGHGHLNLLELAGEGDQADRLSGADLLAMFHEAGGFLPRLVFLSACHSGDFMRVADWDDFRDAAAGRPARRTAEPSPTPDAPDRNADGPFDTARLERKLDTTAAPGFTGTAHALLQGGVPTVVAMRYAVGDDYARDLALEFYRALLADAKPKSAASALTLARRALLDPKKHDTRRYAVCDPATPLLYGAEQPGLTLPTGVSPLLNPRNPCLHDIGEFRPEAHPHFVGRTWELATLGADFFGTARGEHTHAAALVTGLGGMGKTALVAEALALWQQRFRWVLLYQAKPNPPTLDAVLRDIHMKLSAELGSYHEHVKASRADAVYREAEPAFDGDARIDRLARNLVRAMKSEPILLVLDNFETQLAAPAAEGADAPCADPAWDRLLRLLAAGLAGSPSRLLVTSRRPLAALAPGHACRLPLGPLPALEAAHFLRQHPLLSTWLFSANPVDIARAHRLLAASRFHPLLMDRLARLAAQPGTGATVEAALSALEGSAGHAGLPELFAARLGDAAELAYLEGALVESIDRLIGELPPEGRQALWLVALTNQPEPGALLQPVWAGVEDEEMQQMRQIRALLDRLPEQSLELQEQLRALPVELRAELDALPSPPPEQPQLVPLLARLEALGLLNRTGSTAAPTGATTAAEAGAGAAEESAALTSAWSCHELVRERIIAWMDARPEDRGARDASRWRGALAAQLQAVFEAAQHQDMSHALAAGSRALVYAVQAADWDRLGGFASGVVTGLSDPRLLQSLVPHLQSAADAAPEGRARWICLLNLADAIENSGQHDVSLPFYDRAAAMARKVAEAKGEDALQAWADLAVILGNSAFAMRDNGALESARQRKLDSADASRRAGRAAVNVIGSELEALRIDVMQGKVVQAMPEIESRLEQVAQWWRAHRAGQIVPEAPNSELLARAYISALDIAKDADVVRKDWPSALRRVDAILHAKRELKRAAGDIASTRMNRANLLAKLPGHVAEAKAELEICLAALRDDPARSARVLGSLASLYDDQGDRTQAVALQRRALAMCELLPDPQDRATSHGNLANYLERLETPQSLAEAPRHQMAALAYRLVAGLGQGLQGSLSNHAIDFRRARKRGALPAIPRLDELLADSAFDPLARWLRQQQVDPGLLQAGIDSFLDQARALAQDDSRWT